MRAYLPFAVAAAVTFALRGSALVVGRRVVATDRFEQVMALVAPAVLTSMIASALVLDHGTTTVPLASEVLAVVAGALVARRTGQVALALVAGLPVYWVCRAAGLG